MDLPLPTHRNSMAALTSLLTLLLSGFFIEKECWRRAHPLETPTSTNSDKNWCSCSSYQGETEDSSSKQSLERRPRYRRPRLSNGHRHTDTILPRWTLSRCLNVGRMDSARFEKKILTSKEAADYLGIAECTLRKWRTFASRGSQTSAPPHAPVGL